MYALLVKAIVLMKISDTVNFKKIIEDCCLAEIESYLQKKMLKKMEVKEIKECIDPVSMHKNVLVYVPYFLNSSRIS